MDYRKLPGLATAAAVVFGAMSVTAQPVIARNVAQWAEDIRFVAAESGSSRTGKWKNENSPLAIEPMERLSADYPCESVTVAASAQVFKTEIGLNWTGQTICEDPASMMLVLPSLDELRNFNNTKFQPTVDATPELSKRVYEQVERARTGSTTSFKRFRGGYFIITTAQSSKGLQARSIKRLWCDELSEFPLDAGGRGDPVKQALARGDAHDDFKVLYTSTPKDLGRCRISALYEAGDQSRYYAKCPHCRDHFVLRFDLLQAPSKAGGRAAFNCPACGTDIDEIHKRSMLGNGRYWIKTYSSEDPLNPAPPEYFPEEDLQRWRMRPSEGRPPSYHAWQAYSLFKSWTAIWRGYVAALDDVTTGRDPEALKVYTQQVLGQAYDAATDAPDSQKLFEARGKFVKRGIIPAWACELIMAADVQGDRIEWDVYAIGPDLSFARIDWGIVEIDPLEDAAWAELAIIIGRRWPGEKTIELGLDAVGIDSGGKKGVTERVYRFVRGRHNVFALKGSNDADAVPVTKGKRRKIKLEDGTWISVDLWLVGDWALKHAIYSMLDISREATDDRLPGGLYNPTDATLEDFKQYVGEVFRRPKSLRAGARGWWENIPGQANERLDLATYSRALAWKRGVYTRTPAEWQALFTARLKTPEHELPLFAAAEMPKPVPAPVTAENPGGEKKSLFAKRTKL